MKLKISMCEYQGGDFDLMMEGEDGEHVTITGKSAFTKEDREFFMKYMPPCVMTNYECTEETP